MITDKTTCKVINYLNATIGKLDNKSCTVEDLHDNDVGLIFKILDKEDAKTPRSHHTVIKDKVAVTRIRLTEEAAIALFECLRVRLQTRQYHKLKTN
jgi:hypothetical protein